MALYISTVSSNVVLDDLGFTVVHPTVNLDIEAQFSVEICANSTSLTNAIKTGLLTWTRVSGGSLETPSDYSPNNFPDVQKDSSVILNDVQVFNFVGLNSKITKKSATVADISFLGSFQARFCYLNNNVGTRYLCQFGTTTPTSDTVPYIIPQKCSLVGLTFSNSFATANCDIQIYKNGVLAYTWQDVRADRWASKYRKTSLLDLVAGDRISVRHLNNTGGITGNVAVVLFFEITDNADSSLAGVTV